MKFKLRTKSGIKNIKSSSNNSNEILLKANHISPKCLATQFSVQGVRWEMHLHDNDINNPSCPHLHAIGKPWKLNVYTGEFFDVKSGKKIGKISGYDLKRIWNAKGMLKIILAERAIYNELRATNSRRWPELPALPSFIQINENSKYLKNRREIYSPNRIGRSGKNSINNELTNRSIILSQRKKGILQVLRRLFRY